MSPPLRGWLLGLGCAAFAILLAGHAAWDQGWTNDESVHLGWSERLLAGNSDRTATRRYESKTPVSIVNVLARRLAPEAQEGNVRVSRFAARAPQLAWLAALLFATFRFTRARWGARAGGIALMLVALDPNFVAHASVATVDLPYAVSTLLLVWSAVRVGEGPSVARAAVLGAAIGLALATKFSAVLLVIGLAALPIAFASLRSVRPRTLALGTLTSTAVACLVLSGAYLFSGVGVSLGELQLQSSLGRLPALTKAIPLPLPEGFVTGLDLSMSVEQEFPWAVALLGRQFPDGVWYYFAVLWLIKTPLAILAAQIVGVFAAVRTRAVRGNAALGLVALNVALNIVFFSFFFRAQIGYRFVLMCLPLVAVIAGAGLAPLLVSRRAVTIGLIGVALTAGENLFYWGDPIAFSNAAVWPKSQVFRLMADSNLAWGQNRERLAPLLKRRRAAPTRVNPIHPLRGSNTYHVNALAGVTVPLEHYRWLRENATPGGRYTHSFVWYDISEELYQRYLAEERSFEPHPFAESLCQGAEMERYAPRSRVPFSRREQPAPGARTVVCVETRNPAEIGVRVEKGHLKAGLFDADGSCTPTTITKGRVIWSRLLAGRHALCLDEIPNRRDFIPYSVDAVIVVRRHGASVAILGGGEASVR